MWFSGENYLMHYDGNRVDTISFRYRETPLSITRVLDSPDNKLFVGTTKGLFVIDPQKMEEGSFNPVLGGSINEIVLQNSDFLWLGTNQGLLLYSLKHGLTRTLTTASGLPSDVVHGLLFDKDSTLWISTWNGMAILPKDCDKPIRIEHEEELRLYGQMIEDTEGNIWAGGESEISVFNRGLNTINSFGSDIRSRTLPPTYIPWQILLCDNQGMIWHAVPDKLSRYDPGSGVYQQIDLDFDFRIEQLTDLFKDKDGSIWLSTTLGNVYRYDFDLFFFETVLVPDGLFPLSDIQFIESFDAEYFAVGTTEGLYLTSKDFKQHRLLLKGRVDALSIDSNSELWVATEKELIGLEVDEISMQAQERAREILPDFTVSGLLIIGSECWISTFDQGVYRMDVESGDSIKYRHHPGDPSTLSSNHIVSMVLYDNKVFVGTVEGSLHTINITTGEIELFRPDRETGEEILGVINQMIMHMDDLWITSNSGLKLIRDRIIIDPEPLKGIHAKQILMDTNNLLWISHLNGVDVYDTKNERLYNVVNHHATNHSSILFSDSNNSVHVLYGSEIRQYSNTLPTLNDARTIITQCKINGVTCLIHPGLVLDYHANDIQFSLSTLSYRDSEKNRYAVFLEGKDTAWQERALPDFMYQNLNSGKYTLHFKGSNFAGIWSSAEQISFTIPPSPWLTKWSISGYILTGLIIFSIIIWLRKKNLILAKDIQVKATELKKVKKQFQEELIFGLTSEIIEGKSLHSEDTLILQKTIDYIDSHMTDDDFSVENIARELSMSRTKLFRQLKMITGISPSEFISIYRLKLAAEMLKKRTGNISEIAYSVGYKNPAHFSDSFRRSYGCTPSEFEKKHSCNQEESI